MRLVVCDIVMFDCLTELTYLTEERLNSVIESCRQSGVWSKLVHLIGSVFIDPLTLMCSFLNTGCSDISKKHEETMIVDEDKDKDTMVC